MRNRFETKIDKQLKKAKIKFKYESERIPYVLAKHYIPDFIVDTINGKLYIECKGYLRPEDKAKLCAIKRQHPEMDVRIVFYRLNPKYVKWASKVGIKWALEKIPEEWLRGL